MYAARETFDRKDTAMAFARYLFSLSIFLCLAGCGGSSDAPELGDVTGVLTLDGIPREGVSVRFTPESGGRTSVATTEADGSFEMVYSRSAMGAKIGSHSVSISLAELPESEIEKLEASGADVSDLEKAIDKYADVRKTVNVEPGSNEIEVAFP